MKARSQELLDKSVSAMISAIEIYNKPDFRYREETFSILAINSWELLLKAKWLKENSNKIRFLYVYEKTKKKDGSISKIQAIKLTGSGNPFTHSLEYLSSKLHELGVLNGLARQNIDALREIRDSSVHFYNRNTLFAIRLQEVGSACVKNFVQACKDWFEFDLSCYNFYLMPLAFVDASKSAALIMLNKEESNLIQYIAGLDAAYDPSSDYSVSVNVELRFSKSKANDALAVQISNDPNAAKVQLTQEQFKDKYPLNFNDLKDRCKERYNDFLLNKKFHEIKASFIGNQKYSITQVLDPDNPKSVKQVWYSDAVLTVLDKHYSKK